MIATDNQTPILPLEKLSGDERSRRRQYYNQHQPDARLLRLTLDNGVNSQKELVYSDHTDPTLVWTRQIE